MSSSERIFIQKNHKHLLCWFLTAALILLTAAQLFGQLEAGKISGTVRDAAGAVIPGATISVKSAATGAERTVQTGGIGQYQIPALTPGKYEVSITSQGFKTFRTSVEVTVGGSATLDAQLQVGETSAVVEVVGESATEVNTQTQEISQLIDTQQMAQLPSLTRNAYDFVALSGNVSNGDSTSNAQGNNNLQGNGQGLTTRGVGFSINGQRESGTEILLDGAENVGVFNVAVGQDIPIDAVQEYSIVTNNFSPEYGRAAGGVVNVTTKAGTNNFHGSAWEYNRLSAYTANTFANDAANAAAGSIVDPKSIYTRNQFGYLIGGPIIKNKLFISQSTEWTRVRSAATESEEILDPSFLSLLPANTQAYFAKYGTGAFPASGAVTTAGQLAAAGSPIGLINGVTAVSASQPVFDTVNFKAPFSAGGGLPGNQYTLVGRIDFNLSDKTQMFFRAARENINYAEGTQFYSPYPQYDVGFSDLNQSYLYSLTHTFSSRVLNNTKISFTRYNFGNSFDTALVNTPSLMIVPNADPVTQGRLQLPGVQNEGPGEGGNPFGGPQNTLQLGNDLSWTKGKHNMKFGGQFTYIQLNVAYGAYAQAVEQLGSSFSDSMNDLVNVAGNPLGSQLTNFEARVNPQGALPCPLDIFGTLVTSSACAVTPPLSPASYGRSYRYKDWALYAMDSFRLTPRMTVNYGLRYEHYGVQHNDIQSLDSNFYYGPGSGIEQQVRTGNVQIADRSSIGQFWAPRWGTLAPRVGFAYDLLGNGKSSLRGGFGISYERNFGNVTYNASFNPPASAVLSSTCSPSNPACTTLVTNNNLGPLGLPGPPSFLGPVELRMPDPNINVSQTQFWSLALQQQVARNTIVELSYSGAHGVHLYDVENINQVGGAQFYLGDPLVTGAVCAGSGYINEATGVPECLTRPNQQYAAINNRGSRGVSSYNALNLKFQTQDLHHTGLSLVANYTWAHSLDDISSTFSDNLGGFSGNGAIGSFGYTDLLNPKLDWGSSDFDVRNRVVVSPIWETPWYKGGKGFTSQALGGWSLVGVFTARTGTPFSVYDYDNIEVGYTVPRLTPATPISQYKVGSPVRSAPNVFNVLTLPLPASFAPLDPALGMSDLGPFPSDMTHRNAFRGPGAWNYDMSVAKKFKATERVGLEFRAEGFNLLNHHNFYVNPTNLLYSGTALAPPTAPVVVTELKGGLGSLAQGGNNDERRFGQFSLRVLF
jgi:hypothetical protein